MTLWHLPVVDSNLRSLQLLPLGKEACVEIFDLSGVRVDCLLFEVSYETMNQARANDLGYRISINLSCMWRV
jgi:hypothetical protein